MSFGFEFELLIPIFSLDQEALQVGKRLTTLPKYKEIEKPRVPGEKTSSPEVGVNHDLGFVASVEHQDRLNQHQTGTWPLKEHMTGLEIATLAMDERIWSKAAVGRAIQDIADWANNLLGTVKDGAEKVDRFIEPAIPDVNWIGPAPGWENVGLLSADAYIQETYGLRLDRVVYEFGRRAKELSPKLQDSTNWYKPLLVASSVVESAPTSQALAVCGDLGDPRATAELRGFFALIRYYSAMLALDRQKTYQSALGKNAFGVFYYKTQLSTVRRDLGQKYPMIARVLDVADNRKRICEILFPQETFRDWGLRVLAGDSDSIFLGSMNPYSEELFAPSLGPERNQSVGVVVENRQFRVTYPAFTQFGLNTTLMYRPDEWAGFATRLYDRLHEIHAG